MISKSELRKAVINKRRKFSSPIKEEFDEIIFSKVITCEEFKRAELIFTFVSLEDEVNTRKIIEYSFLHGKRIAVPKVISLKDGMEAVEIKSLAELKKNKMGILEPDSLKDKVDKASIDLAIVPGLAFDKEGYRLGYGGGFYDRFLKAMKESSFSIGVAFSFQIFEEIPLEPHDAKVLKVITN